MASKAIVYASFLTQVIRVQFSILDQNEEIIPLISYGYVASINSGIIHATGLGMTDETISPEIDLKWAMSLQLAGQ